MSDKITIHKITIQGKKVKAKEIDLSRISKIGNSGASLAFKSKNGRITVVEYFDTFAGIFCLKNLDDYSWNKNAEQYEMNNMDECLWIDDENSDKVFQYVKDNNIKIWGYDSYTKEKFVEWG